MSQLVGSDSPDKEHCYMLISDSMFVSAWFHENGTNAYGGDGKMLFADFYTLEECMYFIENVWRGNRNIKILKFRDERENNND